MTNREIAQMLRKVAAAYQIASADRFRVIAYERAADSIEHLTSEVKDLWDDGKLNEIPGVGSAMAMHLDELFKTGKVRHFEEVLAKIPTPVYPLLDVPGIGPKRAFKLVTALHLTKSTNIINDLLKAINKHQVAKIEGFGDKSEQEILSNIEAFKRGQIKGNRLTLYEADRIAADVIAYLKKIPLVSHANALGSLRRQTATIGDIDIAVATVKPEQVLDHFVRYPHQKIIERGPTGASLLLANGRQLDLRVQHPDAWGAMLQYFTGSKNHNIKLRNFALERGLSLNEYGIKRIATGKLLKFATEESFYNYLNLKFIPPELREDKGEIERAAEGKLPRLINTRDLNGDLHIHTSYDIASAHDIGIHSLVEHLSKAAELGYEYIGISDHNPSVSKHSEKEIVEIMRKRQFYYQKQHEGWMAKNDREVKHGAKTQLFIMCEVDIAPDGKLALPVSAMEYVDAVIVSLHSSFRLERREMTDRVTQALASHPKVRIYGHPTGRLLGRREGVELDWDEIFTVCRQNDIALEINANPERLDLPDSIVYDAVAAGIKCCINSDAHAIEQMDLARYGISVARRGWAVKSDIVNTLDYNKFAKWLIK